MPSPIVAILIGGFGIAVAAYTARSQQRERCAMLRAVANRRGGSVDSGWKPRLVANIQDIRFEITMWSTKHGAFTEYWAHLPAPGTAWFRVAPTGVTGWLGKIVGAQDIEIGHYTFDDAFVLKAQDPELAKRVWTQRNAQSMCNGFASTKLECDGTVIHMTEPRIGDASTIEAGIDFLLGLAASDPYGITALRALPEGVMRDRERFPHAHVPGPQPILIGPVLREGRARTCARTAALSVGKDDLPPAARPLLVAIGDAVFETDEHETRVCWPTIEADPRRLTAAIELLRMVGMGPSLGVFR